MQYEQKRREIHHRILVMSVKGRGDLVDLVVYAGIILKLFSDK
jgi:hypothetical protein